MNSRQTTGALLLAGGIAIGIGLTFISLNAFSNSKAGQQASSGQIMAARPADGKMVAQEGAEPQELQAPPAAPPEQVQSQSDNQTQVPAYNPFVQSGQDAPQAVPNQTVPNQAYPPSVSYTVVPAGPPIVREIGTTVSGYPIEVGGSHRAVDHGEPMNNYIGENGLMQNPCVDPASVRIGRAYNAPQ